MGAGNYSTRNTTAAPPPVMSNACRHRRRARAGQGTGPGGGSGGTGESGEGSTLYYILTTRTQRAGLANRADARRVRRTGGRCAVGGGRCAANGTAVMREDRGRGGSVAAGGKLRCWRCGQLPRAWGASTPRRQTGLLTGEAEQHARLRRSVRGGGCGVQGCCAGGGADRVSAVMRRGGCGERGRYAADGAEVMW